MASCRASTPTVATPDVVAGEPSLERPVRTPLSLLRVEAGMDRLAAVGGVLFFAQSIPLLLGQLPNAEPAWATGSLALLGGTLIAGVIAAIAGRGVKPTFAAFAAVYLIVLLTWPSAVVDVDVAMASPASYWLYLLLTVATAMASISLPLPIATLYTIGAPVIYGVIRTTPPGGQVDGVLAVLDSVYSILLGGAILILVTVLRAAAEGVDVAQQNALDRYAHAVRQHATEAERVQVDAIVHDSVLTTMLSAARAYTPEAQALAATMAGNAIGHLRDAVAAAPDSEATVSGEIVAQRIESAAASMSQPFRYDIEVEEWCPIPIPVAEAAYSATVQAMVNSLQHAGSGVERWVEIRSSGAGTFSIEVGDRGSGFDVAQLPRERLGVRVSILERVATAGGAAEIDSAPGEGTVVRLRWEGVGPKGERS